VRRRQRAGVRASLSLPRFLCHQNHNQPITKPITTTTTKQLRYRNNSQYKNDAEIRKRAFVSPAVLGELRRIIEDSEVREGMGVAKGVVSSCVVLGGEGDTYHPQTPHAQKPPPTTTTTNQSIKNQHHHRS
jgi:hypothetical protein